MPVTDYRYRLDAHTYLLLRLGQPTQALDFFAAHLAVKPDNASKFTTAILRADATVLEAETRVQLGDVEADESLRRAEQCLAQTDLPHRKRQLDKLMACR